MSVWWAVPAKKPAAELQDVIEKWSAMGFKTAIWRDTGDDPVLCDYLRIGDYPGYAKAVNALAKDVLSFDPACDWIVAGGDDVSPDPSKRADDIAAECSTYFGSCPRLSRVDLPGVIKSTPSLYPPREYETFGVMQPTGDGHGIDTIAGSPWMGREWCQRAHHGAGPMHPDFFHMFVDNALKEAAEAQGVYWQRPDLTQHHDHWTRKGRPMPAYIRTANSRDRWQQGEQTLARIRRGGYAECLPV